MEKLGRMYKNNSGVIVVSGQIKDMNETRQQFAIDCSVYNVANKKMETKTIQINSALPLDENIKDKYCVTAVGYQGGPDMINANQVLCKQEVLETNKLTILNGFISFAEMKYERNLDGSAKQTAKGTPRKPHFDIVMSMKDDNGYVNHMIKVYDYAGDNKIETMKKLFKGFDPKLSKWNASIITGPGEPFTSKAGKRYITYMGYKVISIPKKNERELDKTEEKNEPETSYRTEAKNEPEVSYRAEATPPSQDPTPNLAPYSVFDKEDDNYLPFE